MVVYYLFCVGVTLSRKFLWKCTPLFSDGGGSTSFTDLR
eukprot:UN15924